MTVELLETTELTVTLGAPNQRTIVINPQVGRKIDAWTQQVEMNLYLEMEDFIEANDRSRDVVLDQQNDFEKGAIQIKNSLNKDLGYPDRVKLFRKLDNIFLKPL